jgi:anti-sigma factor (TIGR02949 family)
VDCREFLENVTSAVDERLPADLKAAFAHHMTACPECGKEYRLEAAVKSLVRSRCRKMETPPGIKSRLTATLSAAPTPAHNSSSWLDFFRRPYIRPALGVAVAAVAVLFYALLPQNTPFSPGNVIAQSLDNYQGVMSGRIKPQVVSDKPETVLGFFVGKTEFTVLVPKLKSCSLVGGVLNDYSGVPLAHVVYTHENDLIYMYQACWESVLSGEKLRLPDSVVSELKRTGWFVETVPDGNTVVLWCKGNTLCSAVSHMEKSQLVACLTEESYDPW